MKVFPLKTSIEIQCKFFHESHNRILVNHLFFGNTIVKFISNQFCKLNEIFVILQHFTSTHAQTLSLCFSFLNFLLKVFRTDSLELGNLFLESFFYFFRFLLDSLGFFLCIINSLSLLWFL